MTKKELLKILNTDYILNNKYIVQWIKVGVVKDYVIEHYSVSVEDIYDKFCEENYLYYLPYLDTDEKHEIEFSYINKYYKNELEESYNNLSKEYIASMLIKPRYKTLLSNIMSIIKMLINVENHIHDFIFTFDLYSKEIDLMNLTLEDYYNLSKKIENDVKLKVKELFGIDNTDNYPIEIFEDYYQPCIEVSCFSIEIPKEFNIDKNTSYIDFLNLIKPIKDIVNNYKAE